MQPEHKLLGILSTLEPISNFVMDLESGSQSESIAQFFALKVTEVKPVQPSKELDQIEVTEAGIVKVVNLLHFENDLLRIVVTVPGMLNSATS